jgi:SAM-dependent methyltransferase
MEQYPTVNAESVLYLNALNREFYRVTVQNFDESRGRFWAGWTRLLPLIDVIGARPLRVLDVGCGNGRFGRFLGKHCPFPIDYTGLDNNPDLLERARADLERYAQLAATLSLCDIVTQPPDKGASEVVVVFGVAHHLPGAAQRRELLRTLAERTAPGGLFVFTAWCFYDYERFRERVVAWPDDVEHEAGDYLLDWRRGHEANAALRYCHHIDEAEHAALVAAIGFEEIARFRADGHTDDINRYSILRRPLSAGTGEA